MRVYVLELIASLALGVALTGCEPAPAQKPAAPKKKDTCPTSSSKADDDGSANLVADITYADVKEIMDDKCVRCHAAAAEQDVRQTPYLTSAQLVEDNITDVISEMDGETMPPSGETPELESGDVAVLQDWKDGGFLGGNDNDGGSSGVFYVGVIKGILEDNCTSCHNSTGTSPDLTTYNKAKTAAEASLEAIQDDLMPASGPLSDSDKEAFAAWVNADMPEKVSAASDDDTSADDETSTDDDECE